MINLLQQMKDIEAGLGSLILSKTEFELHEARFLAQKGYYNDALRVLDNLRSANQHQQIEAYHLFARIYAQAGELMKASAYWKQLLRIDPRNKEARAGLEEIKRLENGMPSRTALSQLAMIGSMLVVVALIFIYSEFHYQSTKSELTSIRNELQIINDMIAKDVDKGESAAEKSTHTP